MIEPKYEFEKKRFSSAGELHNLPPIFSFYNENFLKPKLMENLGSNSFLDLVVTEAIKIRKVLGEEVLKIVSLGAGHGQIEMELMKYIQLWYKGNCEILCLDLFSPEDEKSEQVDGFTYKIIRKKADLNTPQSHGDFHLALAHHSLHHIENLQAILDSAVTMLSEEKGKFIISDVVGRNGHMRWPEALAVIRQVWETLEDSKKFQHQFRHQDLWYENWDCSNEGFEGIRAQEVLRELYLRFRDNRVYFWGGIVEPLLDRGFGWNFSPENTLDCDFISKLVKLEERLIEKGILTPTQIIGVFDLLPMFRKDGFANFFVTKSFFSDLNAQAKDLLDLTVSEYFPKELIIHSQHSQVNRRVDTLGGSFKIEQHLREGWDLSELNSIWAVGLSSRIDLMPISDEVAEIILDGTLIDLSGSKRLQIETTDFQVLEVNLSSGVTKIEIPRQFSKLRHLILKFDKTYVPNLDLSPELRPLTFKLSDFRLVCFP